jgi:hypothetical protein
MFLYEQSHENQATDTVNSNEIDFAFYRDVIFHYMSYLSYSINLVIYVLFGGNFRRALKRLFSLTSPNSSQHNHSKSFQLREQSSLRLAQQQLQQQQQLMNQQSKV